MPRIIALQDRRGRITRINVTDYAESEGVNEDDYVSELIERAENRGDVIVSDEEVK